MKKIIKFIALPPLHLIRFIIKHVIEFLIYSIKIIRIHAIPKFDLPKNLISKTISVHNIYDNIKKTHDYFLEDEYKDCYNHFKKYFYSSLIVPTRFEALNYGIKKSQSNYKKNDLYLEFGVFVGKSTNFISKILKDIPLYGFDSFEGLREDWHASSSPKGRFNLNKKIPKLNHNVVPVIGWVQDTLPDFLIKNKSAEINFVYLDLDTYPSTKFVLEKIKPFLKDKCIIVFDQLYNYPGWRVGEYKALIEIFSENEYKYLCFAEEVYGAVVIEFNKKSNSN